MYTEAATMDSRMKVPQKIKNRTTVWPSNPTPGENYTSKRYMHPGHGSNLNVHWQMNGKDVCTYVYTHDGILLSHKKEWNNAICSHRDGPRYYHTKWSNSDRERQIPYNHIHVESKKIIQMNLFIKWNRLTDIENKLMVAKGRGNGGGVE